MAKEAGFCFGVKRALDLAYKNINTDTYSFGPLIHNPQVVADLETQGIKSISEIKTLEKGNTLIIRSHGVGPQIFKKAKQKAINIVDGTCPFVKKAQMIAYKLHEDGYKVIIVGNSNHPEVQGIRDWAKDAYIISSVDDAKLLPEINKAGILSQTTLPEKSYNEIINYLQSKINNLKVHNTICLATHLRQEATSELAPKVDMMVVIGGYDSANTCKLADLCQNLGTPTIHIEQAKELKSNMFEGINKIGVTAGASTPDWIIEEVMLKMVEFSEEKNNEVQEGLAAENVNDVPSIKKGDIITATIVQVDEDQIMVDVGGKSEGIVPKGEISATGDIEDLQLGDKIDVFVIKAENEEGNPILSKRRADRLKAWEAIEAAFENNSEIKGDAVEVVKGGILVNVGVRGFVPASLVERGYVENLEEYIGKELRMRVIELDKSKNKVVLSQKAILDEEFQLKKQETWVNLEVGQVKSGLVRRLTNFGAFVDIGGVDGLLHVSEISWGRVDHPKDVLEENQEINVVILGLDRDNEKVSLGLKQLSQNPWENAATKYQLNSIVTGKVLRIAPFGAFVEVEPGIEGLVHISQISNEHVEKTEDVLSVGDEVEVKVLKVDTDAQRMSLSIKEAKPKVSAPVKKKEEKEEYVTGSNDGGFTIGDLYGDLLKGNANKS